MQFITYLDSILVSEIMKFCQNFIRNILLICVCFKAYSDDRVGERQILGIQGGVSPGTVPRLLQRLVVRAPDVDGGGDRGCCRLDTVSLCRRYICDRSEAQHSANPIQVIG